MNDLAVDCLLDIHFLTKFKLETTFHERQIILANKQFEFRLSRITPRKISLRVDFIQPGINLVAVIPNWEKSDLILNVNLNHDKLEMYPQSLSDKESDHKLCIINNSSYFLETNEIENCFEVTKVTENRSKLPFHHRKTMKLEPLDMSQLVIGDHLSKRERSKLLRLIEEYSHIFSRAHNDIGRYSGNMSYKIELSNPILDTYPKQRFPKPEQDFIKGELAKMLNYGIIEKCSETSRVYCGLVVAKRILENGKKKLRLCLASNLINRETKVADNYPLPEIPEVITRLSGQQMYSQLDMNQAYWQIELPPDQRYLYTFEFQGTVYQFTRSSYGTRGMPSFFSALMFSLVGDVEGTAVYLDDVTIGSENYNDHLKSLRKIFEVFSKYNLTLGLQKCNFVKKSITSFGYVVSHKGYEPCPERIKKLKKLECPKTIKEVQSRLGALNYFCHTVKNFKIFAEPFYQLKKGFEKTSTFEKQWDDLLQAVSDCFLKIEPNFNKTLRIVTDSSDCGGGVVMSQEKNNGWYPVLIDSFIHKGRVRLARISYKEFGVVFRSFKKHKKFILCFPKVELLCDNKVTVALLAKINSVEIFKRTAPSSWLMFLSHFDFTVKHTSGTSNEMLLSDLLSRSNIDFDKQSPKFTLGDLKSQECLEFDYFNASIKVDDVLKASKTFDYEKLRNIIKQKQIENGFAESNPSYLYRVEKVRMPNNKIVEYTIVYHKSGKLIIPTEYIRDFLNLTHVHGSPVVWSKMIDDLEVYCYGMKAKIAEYRNSCTICASINPRRTIKEQTSIMATSQIGELYHIDVVHINNIKVMMAIDHFSSYLIMSILKDEKESSIANGFYDIFFQLLIPNEVVTDNHKSFRSKRVAELMETMNVHHRFVTPRWSSANGKIERSFRSIRNILKIFEAQKVDLEIAIKYSVFVMNNKRNAKSDFSPFEIVTLRNSTFPFNMPYYSLSRLQNASPHTKKFIESAQSILKEIKEKKLADLEGLTSIESVKLYQKGDIVLIKSYPVKGLSSKILSYYDTTEFKIVHVSRRAKTYIVQKVLDDERLQNQRYRIAHNLVKRIRKCEENRVEHPRTDSSGDEDNKNDSNLNDVSTSGDEENENSENEISEDSTNETELDTVENQNEEIAGTDESQTERNDNQGEDGSTQSNDVSRRRPGAARYNLRSLK